MKKIFLAGLFLFLAQSFNAQAWDGKGDQKVQVGFGAWGNGQGITGTYDYGLSNLISVGGGANFYFSNHDNKDFFLFGRLNFHLQKTLNLPDRWDVYPGVDIGVLGNTFGLGVHLGARYFFSEKVGVFVEAGNNGSIGVSITI